MTVADTLVPGMTAPEPATTRVGIAIAIPDPFGAELAAWRARFGDPMAHTIPAHVTIVPPTDLPGVEVSRVLDHVRRSVAGTAAFSIRLSGTGTFRPLSPVTYIEVVGGGDTCDRLQAAVRTGILARPLKYSYHPHVTVAQNLPEAALDEAQQTLSGWACGFLVQHVTVYLHHEDGVWRPVEDVALPAP